MKELKRVEVMQMVEAGQLTGLQAAEVLQLSLRQTRRLIAKYRRAGAMGLVHGNRGEKAHNQLATVLRERILQLASGPYLDYNDTHLTEVLAERYNIHVSRATVRRLRRSHGLASPRKRKGGRHYHRRERKPMAGMLLQTDGSRHDWLEGRGPWLTLIAYIDDASNEVLGAVFRGEEDAAGYFLGLWDIVRHKGCPAAIYTDLHTIFRSPKQPSLAQELKGKVARSQYGRILSELGIELIPARTPQAKGCVERLFGTLQGRLVKALREAGASTLEEANQVLAAYLRQYNQRFMVKPTQPGNVYRPFPQEVDRKDYFCFKHQRKVANDNTISFDGQHLQISPNRYRHSYAKAEVEVRQHLDGSLEICYQEHSLVTFQPAENVPLRVGKFTPKPQDVAALKPVVVSKPRKSVPKKPHKPAADHPWRRYGRKVAQR